MVNIVNVRREAERLLSLGHGPSRHELRRFIKTCRAMHHQVKPALLQTNYLLLHMSDPRVPYDSELMWWRDESERWLDLTRLLHHSNSTQAPCLTVYTDASKTGWGAYIPSPDPNHGPRITSPDPNNRLQAHGPLSDTSRSANWRELHAIRQSLQAFPTAITTNHRVVVCTDSRTAASYVNNEGGVVVGLVEEAKRLLLETAWPRGLIVSAKHVPGVDNVVADKLSRLLN